MVQWSDVFGSNSNSPAHTDIDSTAALRLRDSLLKKYPQLPAKNIGQMPSDALFHAETTVLLRAARRNGGTLAGRTLTVYGDTKTRNNCRAVLPYVGLELGNPTVTFVDPDASSMTMRDGAWIDGRGK